MTIIRRAILALALIACAAPALAQAPPPVPALPDTERRTSYTIAASTCACNVNFALYGDSTDFNDWVQVYLNGVQVLYTDPAFGWTITSPTGSLASIPRPISDAVLTFTVAQTGTVQIVGARRPRRVSQFSENRGVAARDLNQTVTDLVAQNREAWDFRQRLIQAEAGFVFNPLPIASARAGLFLCFDNTGQATTCAGQSSGSIAAGNGISFTGSPVTTISVNPGNGLAISGSQLVTSPGVDTNNPNNGTITTTYAAQTTDCGGVIPLSGNAFYTVTLGAATGFPANCEITLANIDAWGTGRGKAVTVSGLTLPIPILYPQQAWKFRRIASAWFQENNYQLSQAPVGTKLYVDVVNGSNSNDCLASGSGNACHDLGWVVMHVIWQSLVASGGSGTGSNAGFDIRLANDPGCVPTTGANCHPGLHMSGIPKQTEGHNSIMIECDSGSATNCTIADNTGAQAIGMYCACFLELQNVTLAAGSGNNSLIQVEKGMVRIQGGGVVLGGVPLNAVAQLNAINGGTLVIEGGAAVNISGGAYWFAMAQSGGNIQLDQATMRWTANATYGSAVVGAFGGLVTLTGPAWQTNGFTITSPNKIQCSIGGVIDTGGTFGGIPGTTIALGCTSTANGSYN